MDRKIEDEKLNLLVTSYKDLFVNRDDVMAQQVMKGSKWIFARQEVGSKKLDVILKRHLNHAETWGAYAFSADGLCKWLCIDLDLIDELRSNYEEHRKTLFNAARCVKAHLIEHLEVDADAIRIEFSGGKGFHVWILLSEPVHVYRVWQFWAAFMADLPVLPEQVAKRLERFPNQTIDPAENMYGYLVKLPLAKHRKTGGYSYFVDDEGKAVDPLEAIATVVKWTLPDKYRHIAPCKSEKVKKSHAKQERSPVEITVPDVEPPLSGKVQRAFENCMMLARFKDNPELVSCDEWENAGIILTKMGDNGEAWFRWLSHLDSKRWDGCHQELINRVNNGEIKHFPACKQENSPVCDGCPFKSIRDAMTCGDSRRYKTEWTAERKQSDYIDLDELRGRQRECIGNVIDSNRAGVYLLNTPVGAGKSYAACQIIKEKGKRVLWFAPNNHAQADEIINLFGDDAICIYGRDYLIENKGFECPYHSELTHNWNMGISLEGHFCHGVCPKRDKCEYLAQYEEAHKKSYVILMHQHLAPRRSKMEDLFKDRDLVVIDEGFLPVYRSLVSFSKQELNELKSACATLSEGRLLITKWIDPLMQMTDGHVVLPRLSITKSLQEKMHDYFRAGLHGRNILGELMRGMGKAKIRVKQVDGASYYWYAHAAAIPKDKPILILDASGDIEDYKMALGAEYNVQLVDPMEGNKLEKHVHVTQMVTGSYPNASLFSRVEDETKEDDELSSSGKAIINYIREEIRPNEKTGIITTLKLLPRIQQAFEDIPGVIYGHFKKLRGVNEFEDVDTLFVVGYQGVNYKDISSQAKVWFDQDWDDEAIAEQFKTQREWRNLSFYKNGLGYKVRALYPTNPFVRAFVKDIYAEVEQAVGRIRPYKQTGRQRRVFIMTNIPVRIEVDEIDSLHDKGERGKQDQIIAAATQLLQVQDCFTFEELRAKAGVATRTLRTYLKDVCEVLRIREDRRGKKHLYLKLAEDASGLENEEAA